MTNSIPRKSGIYKITHKPTGRKYIGSSKDTSTRIDCHIDCLIAGSHFNKLLQRFWNKYGINEFDVKVIEIVEDEGMLLVREQWYLDNEIIWGFDFNFSPKADRPPGSGKHTTETKRKIAEGQLGRTASEETKAKLRERWGERKPTSQKTRDLISKIQTGMKRKPRTEEYKEKQREAWDRRKARGDIPYKRKESK